MTKLDFVNFLFSFVHKYFIILFSSCTYTHKKKRKEKKYILLNFQRTILYLANQHFRKLKCLENKACNQQFWKDIGRPCISGQMKRYDLKKKRGKKKIHEIQLWRKDKSVTATYICHAWGSKNEIKDYIHKLVDIY